MNLHSKNHESCGGIRGKRPAGFTLVEFLVAVTMFLVVGGAVFALFARHAPYFNRQQSLVGVNIAMQNTVAQMQLDLANAGTGYYPGTVIAAWPIGGTIRNQPSGAGPCHIPQTYTYTAAFCDTLNILPINHNVVPAHPTNSTGGTASTICSNVGASPFYIQPNPGQTPAQTAAGYGAGDQVLLITTGGGSHGVQGPTGGNNSTASNGTLVNSIVLTGAPTVGANYVALPFTAAGNGVIYTNDPLNISNS